MSTAVDHFYWLLNEPEFRLEVKLPLKSKARPRVAKGGFAYMPADYKKAQSSMREELASQWGERGSLKGPVGLYLELYGEARGDIDNIVGFFLDSAGPTKRGADDGILWNDDRLAVIPLIAARWEKCSPADSRWVVHLVSLG